MSRKSDKFLTPAESLEWLNERMAARKIGSLDELAALTGIDKGTLSRYFRHERRPSIDMVPPLCEALKVSVETLLVVLGSLPKNKK